MGLCAVFVLLTALLWMRGLLEVGEWMIFRLRAQTEYFDERDRCPVIPGVDPWKKWPEIRKLAEDHNYNRSTYASGHFHVGTLLKMTTGLDMEGIVFLAGKIGRMPRTAEI